MRRKKLAFLSACIIFIISVSQYIVVHAEDINSGQESRENVSNYEGENTGIEVMDNSASLNDSSTEEDDEHSIEKVTSEAIVEEDNSKLSEETEEVQKWKTIQFGEYPQSRVEDLDIINQLNELTVDENSDVVLNGEKYRLKTSNNSNQWFVYEPIEWLILNESEEEAFVMSKMIIDAHGLTSSWDTTDWSNSLAREWLNFSFYNTAFIEEEKKCIYTSTIETKRGGITSDILYYPSEDDLKNESYGFSSNEDRIATETAYAQAMGAQNCYMTRDTWTMMFGYVVGVYAWNGTIQSPCSDAWWGARPCMKINLTEALNVKRDTKGYTCENILKKNGNFYFRSDLSKLISDSNGSLHNTYNYDESWFFNDSTSYQHELVQMSVRVALAAFGEGENSTEKNIRELMEGAESLKFSDVEYSYPIPSEESIGFAIGSKNIVADDGEKCSLILLAVRGGGYYDEWAGNFHIGEGSRHEGFEYAALQVEEGLLNYLNTYEEKLSNNLKIWITGYSRGAATANLVAADLNNGYIDGLDQKDIFAFCFECPQNTTDPEATDASMYGNIINIINPIDIVTKVAMSDWGFVRYGKSLYLPNIVNNSRYFILKEKMAGYYSNLLYYNGYGSLLDSSVKAVSLTNEALAQAILADKFSSNLASVFDGRSDYVLRTEVDMMETMAYVMGGTECDDMFMVSALIDTVPDLVKKYPINTSKILLAAKSIGQAHYPELCMSWIDSLDGDRDILFDVSDFRYKIVYVNCPVDVTVYDSDENMVAHVVDNTVEEIENGLVAYIDENDQKVIAIPQDADYYVQLSATDNGNMTYTIADYNMQTGSYDQVISYVEVEIEEGNTYSSDILRFNEETEGDISTLRKEGQDVLEPDINESGKEVSNWTVDVNSSGNGIVTGGGRFTSGEFSKVTAVPDEGEEFLGWYSGEKLVSEELEYRFQVKEDIVLVAKFTENCKDISSCKIILEEVNYVYDGTGKKPAVTVKNDSIVLDDEIDYTLTYENNINAGTAVVTITGIGAYKGTVTKEFTINKADQIVGANVSSEVKVGKQSVVTGTGIGTISYETSDEMIAIVDDKGVITGISPGTVIITVTASGDNNYNSASKAVHIIVTKDKEYSIGEWKQTSKGWWYENPDGTYPYSCWKEIDGSWYYFNASGYRVTGWQKIKNTWYYFEPTTGIMYEEQWLELAGKSYYLKKGGAMATGWLELEEGWYYLNSSGIRVTGWMQSGGNWYYLDPATGVMYENEWLENTYYLKSGGAMATGWQKIDGKWYYFKSSGAKATGWLKSGSSWYYFEPTTGIMYESEWLDETYYLKSSGAMATGWQLIGEDYYYFDTSGKKVTGKWVGNYYLKADGVMARSEWVDNDRYYVDENGKWVPGKKR